MDFFSWFCLERCRICHEFVTDQAGFGANKPVKVPSRTVCPDCRLDVDVRMPYIERIPLPGQGSFAVASAVPYAGHIKKLVHQLKYNNDELIADDLGDLLINAWQRIDGFSLAAPLIVPVPLNFWRRMKRGFNQAELLALRLAGHFRLRVKTNALRRSKRTHAQHDLSRTERYRNLENAFRANPKCVRGKSIVLVDDIYTSGATLAAAGQALADAGAEQIFALAVARADRDLSPGRRMALPLH